MDKLTWIGVAVFALIGSGAWVGSYFAYQAHAEVGTWPQADATVIDNGSGGQAGPWYELQWTGPDQQARQLIVYGSTPSRGSTFTVYIDPEDPSDAQFKEAVPMAALIFFILGLGFLGVSGKVVWGAITAERRRADA